MISTNRVLKSHISKLAVVELRNECALAGLSADGLKVDLVDRLLHWATEQAVEQHPLNGSNSSKSVSSGSDAEDADLARRVGRPLKATSVAAAAAAAAAEAEATFAAGNEEIYSTSKTVLAISNENNTFSSSSSSSSAITSSISSSVPGSRAEPSGSLTNNSEVKVQWLGTSSGAPTSRRNVSCIALRHLDRIFLVDCGEGTRNQLRAASLNTALISHIFITHLHGDHCFGIPGTLAAIAAARVGTPLASEPIQVYGPPALHRLMVASFKAAGLQLSTPVIVKTWVFDPAKEMAPAAVDPAGQLHLGTQPPDQAGIVSAEIARTWQSVYDTGTDQVVRQGLTWTTKLPNGWTVTAAQLQHRMPCWGYVFEEQAAVVEPSNTTTTTITNGNVVPRRRNAGQDSESEEESNGSKEIEERGNAPSAASTSNTNTNQGRWVRPGRKMVLLGDTCDSSAILDLARGCDVLSHEATFQKGMEEKAAVATHSTSEQAGAFAKKVKAKNLVLTHFSGRYEQSDKYQKVWVEAKQKGKSMKEMHVSNVVPLAEEARAAAGGAKVFLANDFYAFKVSMPNPVPEKLYLDMKKRQQQNLLRSLDYAQRQSSYGSNGGGGGGGGGNGNGGERERDFYDRNNNSGGGYGDYNNRRDTNSNNYNNSGNGMRRDYNQRGQEEGFGGGGGGGRGRGQRGNYGGGQRRTGGGRGGGNGGY
jgi:ribonuclease Z